MTDEELAPLVNTVVSIRFTDDRTAHGTLWADSGHGRTMYQIMPSGVQGAAFTASGRFTAGEVAEAEPLAGG